MRGFECELRDESDEDGLIFDSVTHPGCLEWTDAHVDAVLGEAIPPLAWTLVGPAAEWSQARVWAALGVVPATKDRRVRFTARLQGRLHVGLTTLRQAAGRFPGIDPGRTERELGLAPSGMTKTWRDRAWYPVAVLGAASAATRAPLWVHRQRRLVASAAADGMPDADTSTTRLLAGVERLRREAVPILQAHVIIRMATHGAIEQLRSDTNDDELAFRLLAHLPALEASQPSLALLDIARHFKEHDVLDQDAVDRFLERYGHRGVNELDPTAAVWNTQRPALEDLIRRMASTDIEDPAKDAEATYHDARQRVRRLPRLHRQRITADATVARHLSVLGERSKDDIARHNHLLRQTLAVLRARVTPSIDPELHPMLSWSELRDHLANGQPITADLQQRHLELVDRVERPATADTIVNRTRLTGVAAAPGVAAGTALVVHDPTADHPDGDILIAHATDTAWTPLFLGRAAIVTDTGSALSHTSIVARDLGIPAVVGTRNATQVIHTGDHTRVDGDRGIVEIAN